MVAPSAGAGRVELGGYQRDLPRGAAAPSSDETPPLLDTLGWLNWPSGTANLQAQAYFDQGYRFAWGFNHAEAARAFRAAQALDPNCAMCFWGEAWVLGPPEVMVDRLLELEEMFPGLEEVMISQPVGTPRRILLEQLELVGTEVMPRLRERQAAKQKASTAR